MNRSTKILTIVLCVILISCSSDEIDLIPNIKFIKEYRSGSNSEIFRKYFYDSQNRVSLIVHDDFVEQTYTPPYDSTFIEYHNNSISRIVLKKDFGLSIGKYSAEKTFENFNIDGANGTYNIFNEAGNNTSQFTFSYTFLDNLLKSYKETNLDGSKIKEHNFKHNDEGNLIEWQTIKYTLNDSVETESIRYITDWDSNKKATEVSFVWAFDDIQFLYLPGYLLSKNNFTSITGRSDLIYEYDSDGYVTKYPFADGLKLEYYD